MKEEPTQPTFGKQFDGNISNVEDMTIRDAIPFVDARYSTYADAEHCGVDGCSWGGGYAFNGDDQRERHAHQPDNEHDPIRSDRPGSRQPRPVHDPVNERGASALRPTPGGVHFTGRRGDQI